MKWFMLQFLPYIAYTCLSLLLFLKRSFCYITKIVGQHHYGCARFSKQTESQEMTREDFVVLKKAAMAFDVLRSWISKEKAVNMMSGSLRVQNR
jgi:hypothetical protein